MPVSEGQGMLYHDTLRRTFGKCSLVRDLTLHEVNIVLFLYLLRKGKSRDVEHQEMVLKLAVTSV